MDLKPNENPAQPANALEARIIAALERKSPVAVPANFAARVGRVAVEAPSVERHHVSAGMRWSRVLTAAGVAALTVAIFFLAPGAQASLTSLRFDLELALLVQLAAGGWWLTARGSSR